MTEPELPIDEPEAASTRATPAPRDELAIPRNTNSRGIILVGARLTTGLVGLAVAAATVAGATWLPIPILGPGLRVHVVQPVATVQERICPGPVLQLGDATGKDATTANTVGTVDVTKAATVGSPTLQSLTSTENPRNVPPQKLTLPAATTGSASGMLAGSQSQTVEAGDLTGFGATACAIPTTESWLVGGSTVTGRTTLVSLVNPSNVISTVDLTVFSENGIIPAAGTEGIVVAPGGQRVFSLAGFAPDVASPAVHVVSTGGQIVATMQQSIVRTLDPGGVDQFGATARPSTLNVIPGVIIGSGDALRAMQTVGGYQDATATLRVVAPEAAASDISLQVTVRAEDGSAPPTTVTLDAASGKVTDFPLGDFPDGSYTVSVATSVPIVASARATILTVHGGVPTDPAVTPVLGATDFAWFAAAQQLQGQALLSVAQGPSPILHLVNTSQEPVTVIVNSDGEVERPVAISAGGVATLPVESATSYTLSGFSTLRAALSYQAPGALASFTLSPPEPSSQPVTVFR